MGWPLLRNAPYVIRGSHRPFRFSHFPFSRMTHYSTPHRSLLHHYCSSLMSHPKLSDWAKRSTLSLRPSCTKSLPAAPASEARPRDFPTAIFLYERLTSGSPLRSFPHPADPAVISVPPRSSSLTTSSATLTTPSASHRHLLPIGVHATVEAPLPVSTPFPTSPPRFSCHDR
jgi:hypothetical protein